MKLNKLCTLFLFILPLCALGQDGSIKLEGIKSYRQDGSQLRINVEKISNYRDLGTVSGSLRMTLWATSTKYGGGTIVGYKLGEVDLGQLNGGYYWSNVSELTTVLTVPPSGDYYVTLTLGEWDGISYKIVHYANFEDYVSTLPLAFTNPDFNLTSETLIELTADQISNPRSPSQWSGDISFELWALSSPYTTEQSLLGGHLIAFQTLNPLTGGWVYNNVSQFVTYSKPAAGTYYLAMVLRENIFGSYVVQDVYSPAVPFDLLPETNTIEIQGQVAYTVNETSVRIEAEKVANQRTWGSQEVNLRLSFWATSGPYSGGTITGYRLGSSVIPPLRGGFYLASIDETTPLLRTPPEGNYSAVITLEELVGEEYLIVDYVNFLQDPLTFYDPPRINQQPSNANVNLGGNVTFTVAATSTLSVTYQWKKNGTNISGANGSSLTINDVQSEDAGTYSVLVSNSRGEVISAGAILSVESITPHDSSSWQYMDFPWLYSPVSDTWAYINGDPQMCFPVGGSYHNLSEGICNGWVYGQWPWAYSHASDAVFYLFGPVDGYDMATSQGLSIVP